jgi:hypothetical protein
MTAAHKDLRKYIFLIGLFLPGWQRTSCARKSRLCGLKWRLSCLDTTSSMAGLTDGAKRKIWSIVNDVLAQTRAAQVGVGLVAYRD